MYGDIKHIHFVGIGGIGMSGIATVLVQQGYTVSGCDTDVMQKTVQTLKSHGCIVHEGNNTMHCADSTIDLLVYSSAIKKNSPEILAAQHRGIPTIHRALMLAELMRTKCSIAVTGAHGKTTTTAIIAHILMYAKYNPTVIVGGHLRTISHNALHGSGDILVAEADESDRSLTQLYATIGLITNIDLEHLETYHDIHDIKRTFLQFLENIPFYGAACICIDDLHIRSLLPLQHTRTITYGFSPDANIRGEHVAATSHGTSMHVYHKQHTLLGAVHVPMAGIHNALNALGAIAVALELKLPFALVTEALTTFSGVERRFSYHGLYKGAMLFDDYGHHPTEIAHNLHIAHMKTSGKLIVIFQPHRFIRTDRLWNQFIDTFLNSHLDHLIITDIYGAGETPIATVSGERLAREIGAQTSSFKVAYAPYESTHASIKAHIDLCVQPNDLVLLLGAGSIYTVVQTLMN
jgi:UDP-N-acetylmuramate--alanine ligase